jgi:hypothetical protein
MEEMRNRKSLVGRSEGKDHLDKYIKTNLGEIRWEVCGRESSGSRHDPVADFREHGNEPWRSTKGGKLLDSVTISFLRRTLLLGISEITKTTRGWT